MPGLRLVLPSHHIFSTFYLTSRMVTLKAFYSRTITACPGQECPAINSTTIAFISLLLTLVINNKKMQLLKYFFCRFHSIWKMENFTRKFNEKFQFIQEKTIEIEGCKDSFVFLTFQITRLRTRI